MGGWARFFFIVASIAATASESRAEGGLPRPANACRFESVGSGKVATVIDGRSFSLDDGREVRLAAIEVPLPPAAGEAGPRGRAGIAARSALAAILTGHGVELRQRAPTTDRYGRTVAHVTLGGPGGAGRSVGAELLEQGFARVGAQVGDQACAADLLARERAARQAKLGLWSDPYYAILAADSGAALLAERGHFTVVEGKLLSVRESGGTIYMNFGRRWSEALTVTIPKRHERAFTAVGLNLKALENRRLRVRGWVDERNGPRIEAIRPEQIEIAERN